MNILLSVNCSVSGAEGRATFSEVFPTFWLQVFSGHRITVLGTVTKDAQPFLGSGATEVRILDSCDEVALARAVNAADLCIAVLPNRTGKAVVRIARAVGTPVVGYVRGDHLKTVLYHFRKSMLLPLYATYARLNVRFLRQTARVVPFVYVGEEVKRKYAQPDTRSVTIFVNDIRREAISLPRRLNERDILHFITVGRFSQEKGVDRLPGLFRHLLAGSETVARLSVVGDGPMKAKVMTRLSGIEQLELIDHGFVSDRSRLMALLRGAEYFVLLSRTEGLPKTLLEAAACGNGLISTDIGSIRAVFGGSDCGIILPNSDDLAENLPFDLRTLRRDFARYSRESILLAHELSFDVQARRLHRFFNEILTDEMAFKSAD